MVLLVEWLLIRPNCPKCFRKVWQICAHTCSISLTGFSCLLISFTNITVNFWRAMVGVVYWIYIFWHYILTDWNWILRHGWQFATTTICLDLNIYDEKDWVNVILKVKNVKKTYLFKTQMKKALDYLVIIKPQYSQRYSVKVTSLSCRWPLVTFTFDLEVIVVIRAKFCATESTHTSPYYFSSSKNRTWLFPQRNPQLLCSPLNITKPTNILRSQSMVQLFLLKNSQKSLESPTTPRISLLLTAISKLPKSGLVTTFSRR